MAERWLVIDDSSTIQRVIKLAFQGYDVVISEADSCQEAAREMMSHSPSLVIADAALGGVQGVQDFLSLKAQAPQAPFIILEGSYDNIDEAQFRAAGFQHFLKKPFDGAQLLSITRQALGRALPYRGEAAIAAAAGAPHAQAHPQPAMPMPPPPPPVRAPRPQDFSNFPAESTQTGGFDLGLNDRVAQTIVNEVRAVAQTTVAADMRSFQSNPMTNPGHAPRKDNPVMSFSLEDDDAVPSPTAAAMPSNRANAVQDSGSPAAAAWDSSRAHTPGGEAAAWNHSPAHAQDGSPRGSSWGTQDNGSRGNGPSAAGWGHTQDNASRGSGPSAASWGHTQDNSSRMANDGAAWDASRGTGQDKTRDGAGSHDGAGWEGPRPAGSHLGNLLEPMLQEEMEKLVRVAVEDYCRKHFAGIARELIQRELDRLTQDRSRLLMD